MYILCVHFQKKRSDSLWLHMFLLPKITKIIYNTIFKVDGCFFLILLNSSILIKHVIPNLAISAVIQLCRYMCAYNIDVLLLHLQKLHSQESFLERSMISEKDKKNSRK